MTRRLTVRFASILLAACWIGCEDAPPASRHAGVSEPWASRVREALVAREYWASASGGRLQAPNRRHALRTWFEPTGIRVADRTAPGSPDLLSLRLHAYGRDAALAPVEAGIVSHEGKRVEIARPAHGLVEWYENSPGGLEQGFTFAARPRGSGHLQVEVAVDHARAQLRGEGIRFRTEAGRPLRYAKLTTQDSGGAELPSHFELSAAGFRIVVDDAGARYPIVIDPLLTETFDNEIESNQANGYLGQTVASAGDVNGDGYADVIVGADGYDLGESGEGAAFLFHGGPDGLGDGNPVNADTVIQGNQIGARLGTAVSAAGDVNGDGYDDVIVGADLWESTGAEASEGAALVLLGSAVGVADGDPSTAHALFQSNQANAFFGLSVASAGDVNGDGYGDVLIGAPLFDAPEAEEGTAYVFLGSASGLSDGDPTTAHAMFQSNQVAAQLGFTVASAGDLNSDGYDDVVVASSRYDDNGLADQGLAMVFHGSATGLPDGDPTTADSLVRGDQATARLGSSVASAGDVNGDGYGDLIVGAHQWEDGSTPVNAGVAVVYHGGPFGIGLLLTPSLANGRLKSSQTDSSFGSSVASAGDVNGDGYGDVVIGAPSLDAPDLGEGGAWVVLGSASGVGDGFASSLAYAVLEADQAGASFGKQVASAGDVNGDGYDDVIVGANFFDGPQSNEGQAFVYHGGAAGMTNANLFMANAVVASGQAIAQLGVSVASAGDVNGDGYDDVIVGAASYDAGEGGEGAAFVFLGSALGIDATGPPEANAQLESDQIEAQMGWSVASAGDVNGDGYADVIVGAPAYDAGESDEGAAFIFLGSAAGVGDGDPGLAHAQLESDQVEAAMGKSVASAGDVNGDGFADVIVGADEYDAGENDEGAAFVFLGSAAGVADGDPSTAHAQIESDQVTAQLGLSVASAGDVNGDGFADVIVGAEDYDAGETEEGAAFVFLGSAAGIAGGDPGTAHAQLESDNPSGGMGQSVASAGDVNGDGYDDVIVGAWHFDVFATSSDGAAFVFLGSPAGVADGDPDTAHARLQTDQASASMGWSVASAGDVNGDGFADVIVGAKNYSSSESLEGAAFVFLGSSTGIADGDPGTAHAHFEPDHTNASMGWSVASAGDVNGDGYADVIVGAPGYSTAVGVGVVFLGSKGGRLVNAQQLRGDASGIPVQSWGASEADDSFTVEVDIVSPRGRERAKLEIEACPAGVAFGAPACTGHVASSWVDLGLTGVSFSETISGLATDTLYHWRARGLYVPLSATEPGITPNPRPGPWRRISGAGGTADIRVVPEPHSILSLAAGLTLLSFMARRKK